jgi:hypothetical protein
MSNLIQIKRSAITATPPSLANGELAYTSNGDVLYIGSPNGSIVSIGGARFPGTLTANQALVANSTSGINQIIASNVITSYVSANGSYGTAGQVLVTGGTGANAYWINTTSIAINTSASYTFSNVITFGSNVAVYQNLTVNGEIVASNGLYSNAAFGSGPAYGDGIVVDYVTGNGRISVGSADGITLYTGGVATTPMAVVNTTGLYQTGLVNASAFNVGTSFTANSTLANTPALNVTNQVNTSTFYAATSANVGTSFTVSSAGLSSTVNTALTGANLVVTGTNTYVTANTLLAGTVTTISSNVIISAANIDATSAVLRVRDGVFSGNVTVTGTLTTLDSVTVQVKEPLFILADGQANTTTYTDAYDMGFYGMYGNTNVGNTYYSGIYRDHAASSTTSAVFKLFSTNTTPTTTINSAAPGYNLGTLQAYLQPYGTSGALIANATNINVTANSTLAVSITANSVTVQTPVAATSGGTGQNTYSTGDLLYASSSSALSRLSVPGSAANGQVLQIVNNLPAYGTLDGGTF